MRRGSGLGDAPFPVVVMIHGGLVTRSAAELRTYALDVAYPSRFLAAGYAVAVITFRSRDDDPQSHCFAFGSPPRSARAALTAFQDTDAFFRRHLNTQPRPIDPALIANVPLSDQ